MHYRAAITLPHGSTELKEIFYDSTLRYVLLKAVCQLSPATFVRRAHPPPPPGVFKAAVAAGPSVRAMDPNLSLNFAVCELGKGPNASEHEQRKIPFTVESL